MTATIEVYNTKTGEFNTERKFVIEDVTSISVNGFDTILHGDRYISIKHLDGEITKIEEVFFEENLRGVSKRETLIEQRQDEYITVDIK